MTKPSPFMRLALRARFMAAFLVGREMELDASYAGAPLRLRISTVRELRRAVELHDEIDLLGAMLEQVRPGDVVYDVGANIGLIGLVLAAHPRGRRTHVFGFEPDPANLERFHANVDASGLEERVFPQGIALGAREGTVRLHLRGGAGEGRHSTVATEKAVDSIEVTIRTAASFAEERGRPPDVAKIDVEGAEGEVLAGMEPLVRSGRPREIFLEVHWKGAGDRMPDGGSLHPWLEERGYTLTWTSERRSRQYRRYTREGGAPSTE